MRLSLLALTASLAILATAAPVNKRDEATEDLGVGVGLNVGKRNEAAEDLGVGVGLGIGKRGEDAGDLGVGLGAVIDKRNEAAEDLGVGVGLGVGKRNENLEVKVNADGTVSSLKRDNEGEDSLIGTDLDANLDVGKRHAASNDASGVGVTINADGGVTVGKRAAGPEEDADISVGAGATVGV
ncbi:uncharacterized protein N7469_000170 [Penicillium citrinum]|uniref:Uncharacterized protein n=1 Tax=Penicillium citrinum TaxID=5077 RepID=A0A9W9PFA2_PENCI|nr:uncharacterized protein N7469_000170 [Penicillium citrinum]KAJ5241843.1 hypothetical protein N7469_000170 [Penicillium citrinum]